VYDKFRVRDAVDFALAISSETVTSCADFPSASSRRAWHIFLFAPVFMRGSFSDGIGENVRINVVDLFEKTERYCGLF